MLSNIEMPIETKYETEMKIETSVDALRVASHFEAPPPILAAWLFPLFLAILVHIQNHMSCEKLKFLYWQLNIFLVHGMECV